MSPSPMSPAPGNDDLPDLPDDALVHSAIEEDLPELPDDAEMEVSQSSKAAPSKAAPAKSAPSKDGGARKSTEERDRERAERAKQKKLELDRAAGLTGEKRELDKAPLLLRKAAYILAACSVVPFATPNMEFWSGNLIGKGLILIGAWLYHQAHRAKAGEKAPGFAAGLAKNNALPGLIVFALFCVAGLYSFSGAEGKDLLQIVGEKVMLILSCLTITHIFDYEHGGKFNPLFPMMFLAAPIAGLGAIVLDVQQKNFIAAAAAAGVTFAGFMAVKTLFDAMKEAKEAGEIKKQAQIEARKAAREARKAKAGN